MPDAPRGIDPRGPRFVAAITAVLLLADVFLGLVGISTARGTDAFLSFSSGPRDFAYIAGSSPWTVSSADLATRLLDPGFLLLVVIVALFIWGVASPRTAPWAALFRVAVAPRLRPPTEREDPRPPRFAQGVGLLVTAVGAVLHLAGVPLAIPIFAGAAFIAAFLNAAFGVCLGCMLYLVLQRAGIVGRERPAA